MVNGPHEDFDVVVLGEVLVQVTAVDDWTDGAGLRLGFSGDALNAAAAAAAAGARTGLLARIPDDELGEATVDRITALGVCEELLLRVPGQHGVYLHRPDPHGSTGFFYARSGSVGSQLCPEDLPLPVLGRAGVVLAGGIACAISSSAAAAVLAASCAARRFVYDPNWRPALTSASAAADQLRRLAPSCALVTPSWPAESAALLTEESPERAAAAALALGASAAAITCGADGVVLDAGSGPVRIPAFLVQDVVDQTGAGDVLAGTVSARLALGDDLPDAVRLGAAAAALSLQGAGGTGRVPSWEDTRALAGGTGSHHR